jgi:hypothetical protein
MQRGRPRTDILTVIPIRSMRRSPCCLAHMALSTTPGVQNLPQIASPRRTWLHCALPLPFSRPAADPVPGAD